MALSGSTATVAVTTLVVTLAIAREPRGGHDRRCARRRRAYRRPMLRQQPESAARLCSWAMVRQSNRTIRSEAVLRPAPSAGADAATAGGAVR
jgi:hypothetical protein